MTTNEAMIAVGRMAEGRMDLIDQMAANHQINEEIQTQRATRTKGKGETMKRYSVRKPGCSSWLDTDSPAEARQGFREAVDRLGYPVIIVDNQTSDNVTDDLLVPDHDPMTDA